MLTTMPGLVIVTSPSASAAFSWAIELSSRGVASADYSTRLIVRRGRYVESPGTASKMSG